MKVYISPGHMSWDQNPFPSCTGVNISEYQKAWHTGYALRDYLVASGYLVMMPRRTLNVSYRDRIDTAWDWWTDKTNKRFAYVTIHSNAHGTPPGPCHAPNHGGTQQLLQTSQDRELGRDIYFRVANASPGNVHNRLWTNFCASRAITELCDPKARAMPIAYMENEFHDIVEGAAWLNNNHAAIAEHMRRGLDCYFFPSQLTCAWWGGIS